MDVVFHVSSDETDDWSRALGNVSNLLDDDSVAVGTAVLVANGSAVRALTRESPLADRIADLSDRGAGLLACQNSLAGRDIRAADLLPDVERVPSAMGELLRRQNDGYAYVKVP